MTEREAAPGRASGEPQGTIDCERQADIKPVSPTPQQKLNPKSKRAAILRAFVQVGPEGMNCFTAALRYGDFVLRTTVSECKRYHGIEFLKRYEQVPGRNGSTVDCVRYTLSPRGMERVRELLGDPLRVAA